MNDITSSVGAAPPPSSSPAPSSAPSTPSSIEPSPPELLDHLAQGEDVTEYAEQKAEDAGKVNADLSPAQRHYNRHQRARQKLERLAAENAALKAQGTGPRGADGTPDSMTEWRDEAEAAANGQAPQQAPVADGQQVQQPEGYVPTPEEQRAVHEQVAQHMVHELESRAVYRTREEQFAAAVPNYREVMNNVADVELPPHVADLIRQSPLGPIISYELAATIEGLEALMKLREMPPLQAAQAIARHEMLINSRNQQRPQQQQQPQRRVSQAKPPMWTPRGGGAGPTRSAGDLAENMESYAADFRRRQAARNGNGRR